MSLHFLTKNYNGKTVYYVELDPAVYELKLISQPDGGTRKHVKYYLTNTQKADAAINGQLMDGNYYVGGCIDSNGNQRGDNDSNSPMIVYSNGLLSESWSYQLPSTYDFVLNCAYYCFLRNGQACQDYASSYTDGASMYQKSDQRSMIGQTSYGTIIFAVSYNKITGSEQASIMSELGCTIGFNLDGGASRRIAIRDGSSSTTSKGAFFPRKVLNAIVAVKKDENYTVPLTSDDSDEVISSPHIHLKAKNTAFRIRNSVVSGTILTTIPVGSSADILQFVPGIQSDGYQWARTRSNGIMGYSQLDTSSDYLIETDLSYEETLFLEATTYPFRIRSSAVNGSIYTTVVVGDKAEIVEFGTSFMSDGYQWVKVKKGNIVGWSQLDLQAYTIIEE